MEVDGMAIDLLKEFGSAPTAEAGVRVATFGAGTLYRPMATPRPRARVIAAIKGANLFTTKRF
jgi:hypothetical protein